MFADIEHPKIIEDLLLALLRLCMWGDWPFLIPTGQLKEYQTQVLLEIRAQMVQKVRIQSNSGSFFQVIIKNWVMKVILWKILNFNIEADRLANPIWLQEKNIFKNINFDKWSKISPQNIPFIISFMIWETTG